MPTYEYKCENCGHKFEKFQSITADAIRKCPKCGKRKVKRLIGTGAGLIFKGAGFYITDYRSESYKNAAKSDAPAAAGTDKKAADGKGSESSKPAAQSQSTGSGSESKTPASAAAPASGSSGSPSGGSSSGPSSKRGKPKKE